MALNPAPVLARGRLAAEALMVDTCTVRRRAGEQTSRDTGLTSPTWQPVYTGACRVQQSKLGAASGADQVGQAAVRLLALEVQLPMSVTGLREGDEITVTASAHDEDLGDRVFVVTGLAHKTHATARRVQAQEVT